MTQFLYQPDYMSDPGETIIELLEERGMTIEQASAVTGLRPIVIRGLIHGIFRINASRADALERGLGVPAQFWLTLERNFQEGMERLCN